MKQEILSYFTTECPWRDTLYWYTETGSTNTLAKQLAKEGALHGTILIAGRQTSGRGRMGRSFSSPEGMGVYLSVILRPNCAPDRLMHLTCAAAVAGCTAVENTCGVTPNIKWTNDLVYGRKKLGGILTELSIDSTTGLVEYAIVGIGINCLQNTDDFPPELRDVATSIRKITNAPCSPAGLAAALTEALFDMDRSLLSDKKALMDRYRRLCMTVGEDILVLRGDDMRYGTALDINDDGGLLVRFSDGTEKFVTSGEVSVRGMYGYA